MMNQESTGRLADTLEARAADVAVAWKRLSRPHAGIEGSFHRSTVMILAEALRERSKETLERALAGEPWGDGRGPRAGAFALVPPLRQAVEQVVGVPDSVRPDLEWLLDAITFALAAMVEKRERELEYLIDTDSLTGVLSRRAVLRELEVEAARAKRFGRPVSVLFMDVDGLKALNDSAGHAAGDETLRRVSRLIDRNTRLTDRLGRVGGDEFLLVMPDTNEAQAHVVAGKLTALLAGESVAGFRVSISIGAAGMPSVGPEPDALVATADSAMRRAKAAGGARLSC